MQYQDGLEFSNPSFLHQVGAAVQTYKETDVQLPYLRCNPSKNQQQRPTSCLLTDVSRWADVCQPMG